MIFDQSQTNLSSWKNDLETYERGKRTKKPFGKNLSHVQYVTYEKIKNKQCQFNPILQTYQRQQDENRANHRSQQLRAKSLIGHLKHTLKHQKSFDIVNLQSNEAYDEKIPLRKLGPIRNAYNVINNQKLPQYFYKNRQIRLPVERQKKVFNYHKKDYNIVSNIYKQHHEQRLQDELQKQQHQISQKYWKTHNYNPVNGSLYNQQKEKQYQNIRQKQEQQHGKDAQKRLPPSYVYRQPLIVDYSKPLPQSLKILDIKNANAKKRFQTKYAVNDQYEKRSLQDELKHEQTLKKHIHFGRILDQKAKQFNIITNNPYSQSRAEDLFGKKAQVGSWQQLIKESSKSPAMKYSIRSGGFS